MEECDPNTAVIECDPGTGGTENYGGYFLNTQYSYDSCIINGPDADFDGIWDECEYQVAYALRPYLKISTTEDAPGREPYWSVIRGSAPKTFRIFYALSYYRDAGSPAFSGDGAHSGDSEFIIVEAEDIGTARWRTASATLSAHYGECCGFDGTGTWGYQDLQWATNEYRGRPIVWVSEDKHANYKTQAQCDAGANMFDNCDRNTITDEVETLASANLGNMATGHLRDCVASRNPNRVDYNPSYMECYWTWGYQFFGWLNRNITNGASPYSYMLFDFAF